MSSAPAETGDGKRFVLLVDDDQIHRDIITLAFQEAGLRVDLETMSDGESALAAMREYASIDSSRRRPALILLDLRMPGLGGLDVLRQLPADWRMTRIPIVVLTSSRLPQDIVDAFAAGSVSFHVKPAQFGELVELIDQIGRRWLHH